MNKLILSVAVGDYDRTRPILDGRVRIEGVEPRGILLSPEELFFRAFRHQEFDVAELSISSHCVSVAGGSAHYVGIPAFLSRAFRHTAVYVRNDRGINTPQDLLGRRIGIAEYQLSANVWVRGFLEQDFNVKPSDIVWVRGGMDTPGRPEKLPLDLPKDIRLEEAPSGDTLSGMLAAGEIDGFIGPRAPRCFSDGHPQVSRLFADSMAAASDYYRRTGIFPIMHLLGVRRALAEANPWLPAALLKAFSEARDIAVSALQDTSATKVTMPFVEEHLDVAEALLGPDYWSYGWAGNKDTLETFCDMHYRQGLSPRRLDAMELFHPATLEAYSL